VLNTVRGSDGFVDLDRIAQHFEARCRTCVRIPWDPHLETGAEASLDGLRAGTRDAYLELAAAIAGGFSDTTERRS
jgi:MinD-like ATPase involved in chromosome partitioning or flagellar assembly